MCQRNSAGVLARLAPPADLFAFGGVVLVAGAGGPRDDDLLPLAGDRAERMVAGVAGGTHGDGGRGQGRLEGHAADEAQAAGGLVNRLRPLRRPGGSWLGVVL